MKAVVAAFNQEKALVGAFSVITNLRMELFKALVDTVCRVCLHVSCPQGKMQSENLLRSECGGYDSDEGGAGGGALGRGGGGQHYAYSHHYNVSR